MDKQPLITVTIPVYNVAQYLPRCLFSVLKQTLKDIEIICVNDGSTDESVQILNDFAAQDKRIKIFSQTNKGLSSSRNCGLENATGQYIFFLDADDYLHPQALEIFYTAAQKNNVHVVVGETFCRLDRDKPNTNAYNIDKIEPHHHIPALKELYKYRHISAVAWNKLYRADILHNRRFIEGILFEDWPFVTSLFADINEFASIRIPLYMYNITTPSIMRSCFSVKKIQDYITGIRFVSEYFSQQPQQKLWSLVQRKRIAQSVKMMLSKISKSKDNQPELEAYFKQEYMRLKQEKIVRFTDLSLKSKYRLLRLMWHQRKNKK